MFDGSSAAPDVIPDVSDLHRSRYAGAIDALLADLRAADELTARAISALAALMPGGGIERATGLPVEMLLVLAARRPAWEARMLAEAATTLRAMPGTRAAFAGGDLSWPEVRTIVMAVRRIDADGRRTVDAVVRRALETGSDPGDLIARVEDEVARLRSELTVAREDRAIERSFLSIQPRVDGQGGSPYAEADAEAFATICEAVDATAPRPEACGEDEARSRAQQRFDGLVRVCEDALAGGPGVTRPRPRFIATIDAVDAHEGSARILWRARGHGGRLSAVTTQTLSCDADVQLVSMQAGRPIGVSDLIGTVSAKARAALVARDRGCRFPGCDAPAGWTDAHHINGRGAGTRGIDDLVLLCRRCHRRVHRHRWRIEIGPGGTASFRHRGRLLTSAPRIRAPARE